MSPDEFLRFYINKDTTKNSLSFQLSVSGKIPKLKDKKNFNKNRGKQKKQMAEPVEMVIIHVQQSFDIAGRVNPVQIEIEDARVLNMFK